EDHKAAKALLTYFLAKYSNDTRGHWRVDTNGVSSKLMAFTHSEYDKTFNATCPDVDLKRTLLEGRITILSLSELADPDGTELAGRFFIADLSRAIGEIINEGQVPFTNTPCIFDEYGSLAHGNQKSLFQLARSAKVPLVVLFQGKAFLDEHGPQFAEQVMGNCWTHVYGDVRDQSTRQFASDMSATMMTRLQQSTEAQSYGSVLGSHATGAATQDSVGASYTTGFREQRETLIQNDDFEELGAGDALIAGFTGTYRLRLPLVRVRGAEALWENIVVQKRKPVQVKELDLFERVHRGHFPGPG
ncbi:MAG: TraM recognition domain-containing protein, partial [Pseudomonadota bacterium]